MLRTTASSYLELILTELEEPSPTLGEVYVYAVTLEKVTYIGVCITGCVCVS